MTSPDSPGDLRTRQRPPDLYLYGEPPPPVSSYETYDVTAYQQPDPAVSLDQPRAALAVAGVAMLIGFALATVLFGVILSDDTDSISGTGGSELVTVDDEADPNSPVPVETESGEGPSPLGSDGSDALVTPQQADDSAMAVSTTAQSTTRTTATTIPPTFPPTSAASTGSTPATATTTSTTAMTSMSTPDTVTGAPPGPGPSGGDAAVQQQVLDLTNAERAKAGCGPVILDPTLNSVADAHSEDMAANNYFDHTGRNGSQPWDRVAAAGYPARASGENIAKGYPDAATVVAGWMTSPGHRQNMLDCGWTELGVGYAVGSGSGGNIRPLYWAQVFATRR